MKTLIITMTLVLGLFGATQIAQACSITASGNCAGSACPTDESCTLDKDGFGCSCIKDKKDGDKKEDGDKKDTKDEIKDTARDTLKKSAH